MAKKFTTEFVQAMTAWCRAHRNAGIGAARTYAATKGYKKLSQTSYDRFRNEAGGKAQTGKAQEAPKRVWRDLHNGKFYDDYKLTKPGTQVGIYDLVDTGTIDLAYASAKKRSRKARSSK